MRTVEIMRTVEVKSIASGKVVYRCHFYNFEAVKKMLSDSPDRLPDGEYLIQGTNSMACKPRISRKAWKSADRFIVGKLP